MKIEIRKGDMAAAMATTRETEELPSSVRASIFETNLKRILEFIFEEECEVQVTFEE